MIFKASLPFLTFLEISPLPYHLNRLFKFIFAYRIKILQLDPLNLGFIFLTHEQVLAGSGVYLPLVSESQGRNRNSMATHGFNWPIYNGLELLGLWDN